jgi:hypothetical protein
MRTKERDQVGTTTFGGYDPDGPSGSGVASNGVAYTWTRTATGVYQYRFDSALTPLSVNAAINTANGNSTASGALAAGTFSVYTLYNNAAANGGRSWSCIARDQRTNGR